MRTTPASAAPAVGLPAAPTAQDRYYSLCVNSASSRFTAIWSDPGTYACERLSSGRTGCQRESPSRTPEGSDDEAKAARRPRYAPVAVEFGHKPLAQA